MKKYNCKPSLKHLLDQQASNNLFTTTCYKVGANLCISYSYTLNHIINKINYIKYIAT